MISKEGHSAILIPASSSGEFNPSNMARGSLYYSPRLDRDLIAPLYHTAQNRRIAFAREARSCPGYHVAGFQPWRLLQEITDSGDQVSLTKTVAIIPEIIRHDEQD